MVWFSPSVSQPTFSLCFYFYFWFSFSLSSFLPSTCRRELQICATWDRQSFLWALQKKSQPFTATRTLVDNNNPTLHKPITDFSRSTLLDKWNIQFIKREPDLYDLIFLSCRTKTETGLLLYFPTFFNLMLGILEVGSWKLEVILIHDSQDFVRQFNIITLW